MRAQYESKLIGGSLIQGLMVLIELDGGDSEFVYGKLVRKLELSLITFYSIELTF